MVAVHGYLEVAVSIEAAETPELLDLVILPAVRFYCPGPVHLLPEEPVDDVLPFHGLPVDLGDAHRQDERESDHRYHRDRHHKPDSGADIIRAEHHQDSKRRQRHVHGERLIDVVLHHHDVGGKAAERIGRGGAGGFQALDPQRSRQHVPPDIRSDVRGDLGRHLGCQRDRQCERQRDAQKDYALRDDIFDAVAFHSCVENGLEHAYRQHLRYHGKELERRYRHDMPGIRIQIRPQYLPRAGSHMMANTEHR